jgi:hypothetical protein
MLKHKSMITTALLLVSIMISGCSQSEGNSSSATEGPLVIDGYTLPPDPGEAGKATLLGIDSNENGVRDDVEIYIYKRFRGFENSKIDRAIAMQYAKATQIIIQEPEKAYENKTYVMMHNAIDCQWYYFNKHLNTVKDYRTRLEYREKHRIFDALTEDTIFNTHERLEAYMQYNDSLSGHVYDSRPQVKDKCEVDIDALGNEW